MKDELKDVKEKTKRTGCRNRKERETQRMDADMMAVSVAVTQLTAAIDELQTLHLHVNSTVTQHTACSADRVLTPQTSTAVPLLNFLLYFFPFCYQGNKPNVLSVLSSFIK